MKKLLILMLVTACARTEPPAPVIYGKGGMTNPHKISQVRQVRQVRQVKQVRKKKPIPLFVEEEISTNEITPIESNNEIKSYNHPVILQEGETLYSISKMHGITVEELVEYNNISDPTNLSIGQEIYIPTDATNKELSFILPVKNGKIIRKFGVLKNGMQNDGINISASNKTPIKAAEKGRVIYVGNELKDYGNLMIIRHNSEVVTAYSHASRFTAKEGDKVRKGDTIGFVGTTGQISKPQLHFAIRWNNKPVNPLSFL